MQLDPKNHAHALYFRGTNKAGQPATLRVTAIFLTDEEANRYMADHPTEAVIAVVGAVIMLADVNDPGVGRRHKPKD